MTIAYSNLECYIWHYYYSHQVLKPWDATCDSIVDRYCLPKVLDLISVYSLSKFEILHSTPAWIIYFYRYMKGMKLVLTFSFYIVLFYCCSFTLPLSHMGQNQRNLSNIKDLLPSSNSSWDSLLSFHMNAFRKSMIHCQL